MSSDQADTGDAALAGKRVLITGGTQGLGAAIAVEVAAAGAAAVVVTGRQPALAEAMLAHLRERDVAGFAIRSDLSDTQSAQAGMTEAVALMGGVDCLVNAGATSQRSTLIDTTPEHLQTVFATNVFGPYLTLARFVEHRLAVGLPGAAVNILSMSGHGGQPQLPAYSASKAAMAALTKNAAHAYRFERIRVNGLNLGMIDTPGADAEMRGFHGRSEHWREEEGATQPQGRLTSATEAARATVFLLGEHSMPMTGSIVDFAQRVNGAIG